MKNEDILQLRKDKKLHGIVEARLKELFDKAYQGSCTLKEAYGVTSGRLDTATFLWDGKIIHVELIASESMVLNDINNLHQSSADLRIVVLMDEKIDSSVSKTYYTANAKNMFPTVWLTDVLDEARENYVLGQLNQLMQGLDRVSQMRQIEIVNEFDEFISGIEDAGEDVIIISLGIYPRRKIDVFEKLSYPDQLYSKLEPIGIISAANPLGVSGGIGWEFGYGGKYWLAEEKGYGKIFFTRVAVGCGGEVVFNLCDSRKINTEISESGFIKIFTPVVSFATKLYTTHKFDGTLDVVSRVSGVKGMDWISHGREDTISRLIRRKEFYSSDIRIPVQTYVVSDLENTECVKSYCDKISVYLARNTKDKPFAKS
ncbi:MAG TPA: hypothetical protein VMW04_00675 [Patescibacteria group bacterium]|nr:hypothetical protein [Patescibacteria group bacterium]